MKYIFPTIRKVLLYIALIPTITSAAPINEDTKIGFQEFMNADIQKVMISAFNPLHQPSVNGFNMFIGPSFHNGGKNETLLTFASKNSADLLIDFGLSHQSNVNGANSDGETLLSISTKTKILR